MYKYFFKLKKLQNMARIIVFLPIMKKQKRTRKLNVLFPKNSEGRTILPRELNRMFQASNVPFRKQKHVLAYYFKQTNRQTPPNKQKTNKQTKPPTQNQPTKKIP